MPRESNESKAERTSRIIDGLQAAYPDAHCELEHRTPLELLIATILSAQCTDKQVNIVTANLFRKYRRAADYVVVPLEELQDDIKRIGLFRNKAKSIQNCCRALVESHDGKVPATMDALVALAGVGRKTANVVLGNAFGINEGIVVDTHVGRLARRLGLTAEKTPEKIELALQKLVPVADWTMLSHWLIFHGRRRCSARKPECFECEIAQLCPSEKDGEFYE
ncbi:MAG: endonuclease III [Verrucomicrobiota bacterium]|nr:endonuclease III [Verrucomicrobiota bacterium]